MKKILFMIVVALASVAAAPAATLCVDLVGQSIIGETCEVSGLTFSSFAVQNAGNVPEPDVFLTNVTEGNHVVLWFNPFLSSSQVRQDIYFSFQVTGYVQGVDLGNAGSDGSSIMERICSAEPVGGICPAGTSLGTMTAFGGESKELTIGEPVGTVYAWKDILTPAGEHISLFTQSFDTPEPMTFVLIGSGMLALGLVRRRRTRD